MSNPFLEDTDFTLYNGDALEVLRTLPDGSVQMCVTSPPFYGLRDYGTGSWVGGNPDCDHQGPPKASDKSGLKNDGRPLDMVGQNDYERGAIVPYRDVCGKCGARRVDQQIGLEETPEQWVEKLVAVFREVRRVLRADGVLWVEVGDSYAGGGPGAPAPDGHDYARRTPVAAGRDSARGATKNAGCKAKDLIGAPWMLAFALRADGWYLRSDIIWSRPNPMPESVTDRPTKSHSYVFLLSKSARYFFDQEAVREQQDRADPNHPNYRPCLVAGRSGQNAGEKAWASSVDDRIGPRYERQYLNPSGRNVRSVWQIATQPYPEAHFATYPEELVRRCVLAGSSERGCCPECGAPWTRETVEVASDVRSPNDNGPHYTPSPVLNSGTRADALNAGGFVPGRVAIRETSGWVPSCFCDGTDPIRLTREPAPCTVLDPFMGSGTTALVARKHGRRSIGIELSTDYCELAARRLAQQSLFA